MAKLPKRVTDRLSKVIPAFQKVLTNARARDVNESDTVMIVTDMLAEVFGFDKYTEVTSEQAIRGTYCDLAIKIENEIKYLIEVKAVGMTLKDNHLRQAVGYGATQGIPWVILTNGIQWEIYRITFERPISHSLICSFDFLDLNPRRAEDLELLYLICREGLTKGKSAIEEFHEHSQIVNRHTVAAIMCSEAVTSVVRRELRRLAPQATISAEEIEILLPDILKRDVMEGEESDKARKMLRKAAGKMLRERKIGPGEIVPEPASKVEGSVTVDSSSISSEVVQEATLKLESSAVVSPPMTAPVEAVPAAPQSELT